MKSLEGGKKQQGENKAIKSKAHIKKVKLDTNH